MNNIRTFKLFKRHSNKGIIFDIAFVGMMLMFVILFEFLEKYIPWLGSQSLKINISLVFIIAAWLICGYQWMILLLLIRLIIGPSQGPFSYTILGWYSVFLLLFSEVVYLIIFIVLFYILKNIIQNDNIFIFVILITTLILSTIFLTIMNGLWMTPLFWYLLSQNYHVPLYPQIIEFYKLHNNYHIFLLGISNYWAGIWAIFGTGNLLKFGIITIIILPLMKVSRHFA